MKKCRIPVTPPYQVLIGSGLLARAGALIREILPQGEAMIVSDSRVAPLYLSALKASLQAAGIPHDCHILPAGEASKNWEELGKLLQSLGERRLSRGDFLIALGGGVIGDITGFAASVYLRGIPYVQIPTTLLAAVDSSVGGKTAVNLSSGKNQAGTFWQPAAVICDTDTLRTLPPETFKDGAAESLKYGVIGDAALFDDIAHGGLTSHPEDIIAACVSMKGDIVGKDEKDIGLRQLLNLGHTFGHTIEARSHFAISHGHGVAIGMVVAARAAALYFQENASCAEEIADGLSRLGLPTVCPYPADELLPWLSSDKKRRGTTLTLVLPQRIGTCRLCPLPEKEAKQLFCQALS